MLAVARDDDLQKLLGRQLAAIQFSAKHLALPWISPWRMKARRFHSRPAQWRSLVKLSVCGSVCRKHR